MRPAFPLLKILPYLIFSLCTAVFWYGAAPSVTYHDAGEFALAAATFGIPHPPGAPSYTLLAGLWVRLCWLLAPGADAARLTNLFSGLLGAATIGIGSAVVREAAAKFVPEAKRLAVVGAMLVVPATLLRCPAFVEQSTTTEQYTFLTALLAAAIYLSLKPKPLWLGLVVGLAIANHLSQIILLPLILCGMERRCWGKHLGTGALGLLLGLSTFLYLPLRSRANPVLDWGNIETWDRFVWAITRQQWKSRPMSEAPAGMIPAWIESYDWLGQVGPLCLALCLVGMVILWRRRTFWMGIPLFLGLAYGTGMLVGHLRQDKMDLAYIRGYGVSDWHIPLYFLLSLFAALGLAFVASYRPFLKRPIAVLSGLFCAWSICVACGPLSMRRFDEPQTLVRELLQPLAPDAIIFPAFDSHLCTLLYAAYAPTKTVGDRTVGFAIESVDTIENAIASRPNDDLSLRERVVSELLDDSSSHKNLNVGRLPSAAARQHLYVTYFAGHPHAVQYLAPQGFQFELSERPLSNAEVLARDRAWQKRFPTLLRHGTGHENRMERETRALQFQSRGAYFYDRKMWPEAIAAFEGYLSYLDNSGDIWQCLGFAREQLGDRKGAADAYARAIESEPNKPGRHASLAILLAESGQLAGAVPLMEEEARLSPNDPTVRANLARMQAGR